MIQGQNIYFSIIIPTYNRAHLIAKSIKSVQDQTYTNWECIIVDDGSTDNTKEIVRNISNIDNRVRYVFQENAERSAARNNGINHAKGDFICFLDSDDEYLNNHLFVLAKEIMLRLSPIAFFFTDVMIIEHEKNDRVLETPSIKLFNNPVHFSMTYAIIPPRVCIHKKILTSFQFDEDIVNGEDSILWSRILEKYPMVYIPEVTVKYHLHDDNSINIRSTGVLKRLYGLKTYFNRYPYLAKQVPHKERLKLISDTHFNICKHFIFHRNYKFALKHLITSFLYKPIHNQNKHKVFLLVNLCLNKAIKEYQ